MSAETMRRAASLMRTRAEAASGPEWGYWQVAAEGRVEVYVPNGTMDTDTVLEFKDFVDCEECSRPSEADADHIASMSPAIALAVADWLDEVAGWREEGLGLMPSTNLADAWGEIERRANRVARVYLGESS